MEEMNNQVLENVEVVIEDTVSDITLGEKALGYTLVGLTTVGAITLGVAAVKGGMKLYKKFKSKKESVKSEDEEIIKANEYEIPRDQDETDEQ